MSAVVLRFRANALHFAKQYAYNNSLSLTTMVQSRRAYAADASTAAGKKVATGDSRTIDTGLIERLRQQLDGEVQTGHVVPVFKKALYHADRIAIKDEIGEYTYHQIYSGAKHLAEEISQICGKWSVWLT